MQLSSQFNSHLQMAKFLSFVAIALAVVLAAEAGGHGPAQENDDSRMARSGGWGGQQEKSGGWQGQQGRSHNDGQGQGWGQQGRSNGQGWGQQGRSNGQGWGQQGRNNDWQQGGRQGDADSRYTANIFNDDEVYGYEAKYPNGEALYVNYRNSEARSRRGPGFARSNSISARMNGMNSRSGTQDGQDWQQEGGYRGQRGAPSMDKMSAHSMW